MKTLTIVALVVMLTVAGSLESFASDWDIAGKILTGITGLRVITGGKVDLVGGLTGINKRNQAKGQRPYRRDQQHQYCKREWIPSYVWEKEWIPTHSEYSKHKGEIIVEGHYIRYKIAQGGNWQYRCQY